VEKVTSVSAQQISALAEQIYCISTLEDPKMFVTQFFKWLNIPLLDTSDGEQIVKSLEANRSFVLDAQLESIAQGLKSRMLVKLDSILAWLNAKGFRTNDSNISLDKNYLADKFTQMGNNGIFSLKEIIPGLIMALTHERSKICKTENNDAAWGDGGLDSIQITLLLLGFIKSALDPKSTKVR
jgi:hypothetical protein